MAVEVVFFSLTCSDILQTSEAYSRSASTAVALKEPAKRLLRKSNAKDGQGNKISKHIHIAEWFGGAQ